MIEAAGARASLLPCLHPRLPFILLLLLVSLCDGRQLRWIAEGDGSLQDASNWDTGDAPTASDDLLIVLPTPPTQSSTRRLHTTHRLTHSAFAPPSLDDLPDALVLTLSAPLVVASLVLRGAGTLVVDQPLSVDGRLVVGGESIVRVRGGELTASEIECDGVLSLELGSVSSTATASASASSSGTLHISHDGLLLLSGPGGSNHIQHYAVDVHGGMVTLNAPVLLQHTTLRIHPTGVLILHSEMLSTEGDDTVSHIINDGTLLVTSDDKQSLLVPLTNTGNLTLLSPSSLSILSPLHCDGTMTTRHTHRLILSAPVLLTSSASLHLHDSSTVHVQSDRLTNRGVIRSSAEAAADGGLVVWSMLNCSEGGELDVRRVVLREGSVWGVERGGRSAVRQLQWSGGQIAGSGTVAVLDGQMGGGRGDKSEASSCSPAVPKVLDGVEFAVSGRFVHDACSVLMLRGGAQLTVSERGEYSMRTGATLHCDTDDSQLTVSGRLTVEAAPQHALSKDDGNDNEPPTVSINVPLKCQGNLSLLGPSTTVLHRSSSIDRVTSQSSPTLLLQPTTLTTAYTFHQPLRLASAGSRLVLQTARNVALLSAAPSDIDTLEIRDGRLQMRGGLNVAQLRIGTAVSPGVLEGGGVVSVGKLEMVAGSMQLEALRVSGGMNVHHSAAKHLDVRNLTLQSSSVSRVLPALLSLSLNTTIVLQPAATLTLSPSVTLYTANATADDGSQRSAHLHIQGSVVCAGSGHGTTSLLVDVTHSGSLTINNSASAGQYSVLDRYGQLGSGGAVSVQSGSHVFMSPLSLHALWMDGGTARFLTWLSLDHAQLSQGELVLHSSLNTSTLLWSGGTIRGYPLLSSVVRVMPDGSASLASNSTLTLDGVALLLHSALHWTGGDIMLRNEALLRAEKGGSIEAWTDGKREAMVVADGSSARIESAGTVLIHTSLTLHVPLVNSGQLRLLNGSDLSMHADYVQAGEQSSLRVEDSSRLHKTGGDLMVAQGSVAVVSGAIHGSLEVSGELIVGESSSKALVDGDLILAPSAFIRLHCPPTSCRRLTVNGTLFANGHLVTDDRHVGFTYHVLEAVDVHDAFISQPHQSISTAHGKVELRITASTQPGDPSDTAILHPTPPLYLPFLPLSDYLSSAALAQQSANVSCAAQLQQAQAAGVMGLSRRSSAGLLIALMCLSSAMAAVLAGMLCWWWADWKSGSRQGEEQHVQDDRVSDEHVTANGAGEADVERHAGVADVSEQQMDVHYM